MSTVTTNRKLTRAAPSFRTNSRGLRLDPLGLLGGLSVAKLSPIETLADRSIVSAKQFDRETVLALAYAAAILETNDFSLRKPLDGKVVVTAFFEASTRTRLSFESAVLRLDGKVLSVPDGRVTGIQKGESLADIGEMLNTYGDAVVMRHPETNSVQQIMQNLEAPFINAGNGSDEHPTQALIDWYALLKWRPELARESVPEDKRIHIGIIGTPGSMRAVNSFVRLGLLFPGAISRITVISELAEPLGDDLAKNLESSPIEAQVVSDARDVLPELDVIYMNSIAFLGDSYTSMDSRFKLDASSTLNPGAVIMHPLARRDELDTSLDDTAHNLYFAQAAGAVFMRQAVLAAVLARVGVIKDSLQQI